MNLQLVLAISFMGLWFITMPIIIKISVAWTMKNEKHTQGILKGFVHKKNIENQPDMNNLDSYDPNKKNFPVVELEVDEVKHFAVSKSPTLKVDDSHIGTTVPLAYIIKDDEKLSVHLNDDETIRKRKRLWIRGVFWSVIMTVVAIVLVLIERVVTL